LERPVTDGNQAVTVFMQFELSNLFCRHVVASFDKQVRLSELVGDFHWHLNLASGLLSFADRYKWHVQILGTESDATHTWLWAWADEASNIPSQLLGSALTLRLLGEHYRIPELSEPQFPLGEIDGHFLAIIASGVCRANAYYRCPFDDGAAFLLIKDDGFPRFSELPLNRIASVFPQAISCLDIHDHRLAFAGYLEYYGLPLEEKGSKVIVKENGEPVFTAAFDELNRLTNLEATLNRRQRQ
jgi:hypothetical protein